MHSDVSCFKEINTSAEGFDFQYSPVSFSCLNLSFFMFKNKDLEPVYNYPVVCLEFACF